MSVLRAVLSRLAQTPAAYLAQAGLVVAVEKRNRVRAVEAMNALATRLNELEAKLHDKSELCADLAEDLFAARKDTDAAREEHRVYLKSSAEAYGKSFGDLAAVAAQHGVRAETLATALRLVSEECGFKGDPEHDFDIGAIPCAVANLAESKRKEAIRESTRVQLETIIRDALDPRRIYADDAIPTLVRHVANELGNLRANVDRLARNAPEVGTVT